MLKDEESGTEDEGRFIPDFSNFGVFLEAEAVFEGS
jgi:hypothetical protein